MAGVGEAFECVEGRPRGRDAQVGRVQRAADREDDPVALERDDALLEAPNSRLLVVRLEQDVLALPQLRARPLVHHPGEPVPLL